VVLVTAIEPGEEATLEGSREMLRGQLAQAEAIDVLIGLANRFDDSLAGGMSLEEAAAALQFDVRRIPNISDQARTPEGETVTGLPALNEFLQVLNRTASGETSVLSETLDGDYFIVRVDGETPAKKKPLEEVKDEVAGMWRAGERARLAKEQADALAERLRNGEDFATLAAAEKLTVQQTEPITRFESNPQRTPSALLSQQLFDIAEGEVTTTATGSGQVVARLKEVLPPESAGRDEKLAQVQAQLTESLQNDIFQQFLGALQQEFDVTINQRLVDQVLTEF
jgi:peptidyl-prolyl cis-trans isomerase D